MDDSQTLIIILIFYYLVSVFISNQINLHIQRRYDKSFFPPIMLIILIPGLNITLLLVLKISMMWEKEEIQDLFVIKENRRNYKRNKK